MTPAYGARVPDRFKGKTADEIVMQNTIDRLTTDLAKARATLIELVHDCCLPLPHEQCVFRPGGTNGWSACCAARRTLAEIDP